MHTAKLRGSDFEIIVNGRQQDHAEFFRGFTNTRRLGIVAPRRIDGVGAANLLMAYGTAFYDVYRAAGKAFSALADFFVFQSASPVASYAMFDIWPYHKWVDAGDDASERLHAISDRGVNVLIVPDGRPTEQNYDKYLLESARRNIDTCYVYSFEGQVKAADLTIRCQKEPISQWINSVFETSELSEDPTIQRQKSEWSSLHADKALLEQSYRQISLDDALLLL